MRKNRKTREPGENGRKMQRIMKSLRRRSYLRFVGSCVKPTPLTSAVTFELKTKLEVKKKKGLFLGHENSRFWKGMRVELTAIINRASIRGAVFLLLCCFLAPSNEEGMSKI